MSLLREISDSLIKYGEILINKTEHFTQTARIRIEIRKKELEINSIKILVADHVILQTEQQKIFDTGFIGSKIDSINRLKSDISELRSRLEEIKKQNSAFREQPADKNDINTAS